MSSPHPISSADHAKQLIMIRYAFLATTALYTPIPFLLAAAGEGAAVAVPEAVRSGVSFAALGAGVSSIFARRWWINSVHAALDLLHDAGERRGCPREGLLDGGRAFLHDLGEGTPYEAGRERRSGRRIGR